MWFLWSCSNTPESCLSLRQLLGVAHGLEACGCLGRHIFQLATLIAGELSYKSEPLQLSCPAVASGAF